MARRDLGNRASPVDRAHMKKPLERALNRTKTIVLQGVLFTKQCNIISKEPGMRKLKQEIHTKKEKPTEKAKMSTLNRNHLEI